MELALDKVPLRIDVLFFATVLGVLALSVLAVRVVVQRAGQAADLWTMRAAMGAMLWLVATGLAALSGALHGFSLSLFTALMILTGGVAFSRVGTVLVAAVGPVGLIGFQFFRVPVAVFLRGMYQAGQVPVQVTYEGLNLRHLRWLDCAGYGLAGLARQGGILRDMGLECAWVGATGRGNCHRGPLHANGVPRLYQRAG